MADDPERLERVLGHRPENPERSIRFRTLGCFPLTGAVESEAADAQRSHPGDAAHHHVGAPGPRHRQGCGRRGHGEEEAGRVLLIGDHLRPIYKTEALIAEDIDAYLDLHQHKTLLRFITCGSVDDGKSTLIGRLLYDSKMIFEDQLASLEADSKRVGTQGQEIDFALLVDGLAAEREQGITIDVAYRFFGTEKRKFIVADTPGHEQYTRNMVTGASTADLAVILIDARKGVLTQTRRHSYLAHLIGVRHMVLAVNKMDLVGFDQATYDAIVADYRAFADSIGIAAFTPMPISGFKGDNITARSANTPWYDGPTLMEHLESVEVDQVSAQGAPFRMPVQWVNRPNLDFRGFSGLVGSGVVTPGTAVRILPSGKVTKVSRIVTLEGDLEQAVAGQSVTLTLADEVDCSRGDVIAAADSPPQVADQFEATIVWMADEPMLPGRPYWLKLGTQTVTASIQRRNTRSMSTRWSILLPRRSS
jgi:bifunctional enzyme CysN/CysC